MKRKLFYICLILVLVTITLMPVPALAMESFSSAGTIDYISPGTVFPAGASGRWIVAERELTGVLSGDFNGPYTMTYKANVESLDTQAGNFHGTLIVNSYTLKVNGRSEPIEFVDWYAPGVPIYKLTIGGHWTCVEGTQGRGDFDGYAFFIPTREGHVGYILDSYFNMTGKWKP